MNRIIFIILFLLIIFSFRKVPEATGVSIVADTVPSGVPQLFGGKYYKFNGYVLVDSFIMTAAGDTNNIPYFPSLEFKSSDNRWYGYDRTRWQRLLFPGDTTSLSNRIDGKLSLGDTATMLSPYINITGFGLIRSTKAIRVDTSVVSTPYDLTQIPANNGIKKSADTFQLDKNILLTSTGDQRVDYTNFFVDGINGSNSNNGLTESTPKQTVGVVNGSMTGLATYYGQARLAIKYNSYLHEQYTSLGYTKIGAYGFNGMGRMMLPALNGADVAGTWTDTSTIYKQTWTHDVSLGNPDYNYIYVVEIDTAVEKIAPFSARRYLTFATSIANCIATPSSCFTVDVTVNPITVYVNPTGGNPNASKYRYEIVKRDFCFDARSTVPSSNNILENTWYLNSGHGYGMVGTGDSTIIYRSVLQGGGTHNAVIASGIVDRNVWLPGPHLPTGSYTIVAFKNDVTGLSTRFTNNIFFDGLNEIYAHQGVDSYADEIVVDGNFFFGDTVNNYSGSVFGADNLLNSYVTNNYAEGYQAWGSALTLNQRYENNIFRNISGRSGINYPQDNPSRYYWKNNLLINRGDANGLGMYGMWLSQGGNKAVLENNNFHSQASIEYNFLFGTGGASPDQFKSYRNLFLIDNEPGIFSVIVQTSKGNGSPTPASVGYKGDSNVYIINGGDVLWRQVNPSFNHQNIQSWRDSTGQDLNSLVFYTSMYQDGLKAFFVDPENGDYTLASTPQGDSIRALQAGMTSPPSFFPSRPSYEQAVESILNPGTPADRWKYGSSNDVVQPGDFIQNQNAVQQNADFWINTGKFGQQTIDAYNAGNTGLRITAPNTALVLGLKASNASGFPGVLFMDNNDVQNAFLGIGNGTNTFRIGVGVSKQIDFETNGFGTPKARLSISGNFIVGTPASEVGGYTLQSTGGLLSTGPITFNLTSDATGDLYARNGSGVLQRIAAGTSGHVLTSNGAATLPTWQAASSQTLQQVLIAGSTLTQNNTIINGTNQLDITGSRDFVDGYTFGVTNTTGSVGVAIKGTAADGRGVWGEATSGAGLYGSATSGYGVASFATTGNSLYSQSSDGVAIEMVVQPSSTNTVVPTVSSSRASTGTPTNGIGQSYDFYINTSTGVSQLANQIISKWTDATNATRTSQFEVFGVNSGTAARKMAIAGTGQLIIDGYGAGTFTGTPTYDLQVTSTGNVIEKAANISNTATLDFGSTAAGASTDLTMTVTGAAVGDVVAIGVPNGSVPATGSFMAWVSATNTVTVRYVNNALVAAHDPASGTFKATIIK